MDDGVPRGPFLCRRFEDAALDYDCSPARISTRWRAIPGGIVITMRSVRAVCTVLSSTETIAPLPICFEYSSDNSKVHCGSIPE